MNRALRVLNIEDSEMDSALVRRHLSVAGYELISERVDTPVAMKAALQSQEWDVILCDYAMPHFSALAALALLKEMKMDIPFIVISGTIGEGLAVEAMRAGAQDYLMKDNLARLAPAIEREFLEAENRRARRRSEESLRESEDRYRDIVEHSHDMICTHDLDGLLLSLNRSAAAVLGYDAEGLLGLNIRDALAPEVRGGFDSYIAQLQSEGVARGIMSVQTSTGERRICEYTSTLRTEGVAVPIVRGIAHDVTEQKRAEQGLRESEARYRLLFESNPLPMWVYDIETLGFLAVNDAAFRHYGYSAKEFSSMTIKDIRPPEDVPSLLEKVSKLDAHIDWAGVWKHCKKDGTVIDVEITSHDIIFAERRARLVLANDVTARKRAERLVRLQAAALKAAANAILITDVEGAITWVNPAFTDLTGYTLEEVLGKNPSIQNSGKQDREFYRELWNTILSGQVWRGDMVNRRKDGSFYNEEQTITPVLNEAGELIHFIAIKQDVTERKRTEKMYIRRAAQVALREDVNAALAESKISLRETLGRCSEAIVRHLDAGFARIWTFNKEEDVLELQASAGMYTHIDGAYARVPLGASKIGLIAEQRQPHITNDVQTDSRISDKQWAVREGMVAFAGYPLIVEDRLVGVMAMFGRQKLPEDTLDALASVADIISQGIERKRAEEALRESEEQLRQSQKLEAVGQLAGGVAHDFNNLLTVITGYSDLLLRQLGHREPMRVRVEEIKKAAERAASLTRQLLAFSRKQVLQPKVIELNAIVADIEKMLRRLIGEDIDLLMLLDHSLGRVKADPGQIEQVILNLSVNARDAMPKGGKLTIETRNVHLDKKYAATHVSVRPGHYVMLAVSDNGCGMSPEVQARVFEPFFTTKEHGKGTGLGLSTVYGIVKQSGGNIWVYSEVGKGTTIKVYLPRVDELVANEEVGADGVPLLQGRETVLLAEDEDQVRDVTKVILEMNGYKVLEASSGEEALRIFKSYPDQIHLIMTDVVMSQMSGRELARTFEALRPSIKVLYMSGYTDDAIVRHGLLDHEIAFLQKPFTPDTLMRKLREVLDGDR